MLVFPLWLSGDNGCLPKVWNSQQVKEVVSEVCDVYKLETVSLFFLELWQNTAKYYFRLSE